MLTRPLNNASAGRELLGQSPFEAGVLPIEFEKFPVCAAFGPLRTPDELRPGVDLEFEVRVLDAEVTLYVPLSYAVLY